MCTRDDERFFFLLFPSLSSKNQSARTPEGINLPPWYRSSRNNRPVIYISPLKLHSAGFFNSSAALPIHILRRASAPDREICLAIRYPDTLFHR